MPVQRDKIAFLHIPKTGGRALGSQFDRLHPDDPHWYFSFFGLDRSQGGNQILVEAMRPGDENQQRVAATLHFQHATMVAGHFSANLESFFPEYSFRYVTVLREPVQRVISNIYQYTRTTDRPGHSRFAGRLVPDRDERPKAYWASVAETLWTTRGRRIPGLWPHESMMLSNGMCRVLSGTPLHTFAPGVSVREAVERAATMQVAWFSDFNATVTRALAALGVTLVLDETNNPKGSGSPADHMAHEPDYGCPDDVRNLIMQMNQGDLELYRTLTSR
jgi:hypothetical protein